MNAVPPFPGGDETLRARIEALCDEPMLRRYNEDYVLVADLRTALSDAGTDEGRPG